MNRREADKRPKVEEPKGKTEEEKEAEMREELGRNRKAVEEGATIGKHPDELKHLGR